jgi:long-chain acyl-CoA synthetase
LTTVPRHKASAFVWRFFASDRGALVVLEQVKRFAIVPGEWLPAGEQLTPTSKLRRPSIAEKYAAQMDALYS